MDPLRNPKDPLHKSGPEGEKELFQSLSSIASGYPIEFVASSAMNLIVNAIRQNCKTREDAEVCFDEFSAKTKKLLLEEHYNSTGRNNIFPYHQIVNVPNLGKINNG